MNRLGKFIAWHTQKKNFKVHYRKYKFKESKNNNEQEEL